MTVVSEDTTADLKRRLAELEERLAVKACERDARHIVHNIRNLDVDYGTKGSLPARDIRCRTRRTCTSGRNTVRAT